MHRLLLGTNGGLEIHTFPEMTVNEAVEAMERFHERHSLVGRDGTPLGMLTEEDIVSKVLARGLDPNAVRVADVMLSGHLARDGKFLVDDSEQEAPLWAAQTLQSLEDDETRVLTEVLNGRCEECAVYSDELVDHEGLQMCPECSGFRAALFS
ncbi:MAG TPA: CBS domain-containing protein [Candidatus Thermoplasmatota archaeon]|nr:CBS domain-containing protein [Candidatus Thermoplasmatota archaeon]